MSDLTKINPGDKFVPDAGMFNDFIDAANDYKLRMGGVARQPRLGSPLSPCYVEVVNSGTTDLGLGDCVYVAEAGTDVRTYYRQYQSFPTVLMKAILATKTNVPKGAKLAIMQEPVKKGDLGKAMISGLTWGNIAVRGGNVQWQYAIPDTDSKLVLYPNSTFGNDIPSIPLLNLDTLAGSGYAILCIGSNAAAASVYNGYFKIQRLTSGTGVEVINGTLPESNICGYTDLPGGGEVPRATFSQASGTIYLYAKYNSTTKQYSVSLTDSTDAVLTQLIGSYNATTITQTWQDGTIRFSRSYFV